MAKRKNKLKTSSSSKFLWVRICLSVVIIVAMICLFYYGGGLDLFKEYAPSEEMGSYDFEVHFIDVGQGDATLIRLPDDKTVLIDTGENKAGESLVSYISQVFDYHNLSVIDYLILTHQDDDHIGSGVQILETFQVNCVYRPMQRANYEVENFGEGYLSNYPVSTTKAYSNVIEAVYNEPNCEIKFSKNGESIIGENYSFNFLSPTEVSSSTDNNNFSPIIMLEYNGAKIIFTGDAESEVEKEVAERCGKELKADVLKVGHHGSNTSSCQTFLDLVRPSYSIISVGEDNQYNLPSNAVVERLKSSGSQVLTTAENGTIVLTAQNGEIIFISHHVPNTNIIIILCAGFVILMLVWGIRVKKKN